MSKGKIPNISHSKRSSTPKRLLQKERLTHYPLPFVSALGWSGRNFERLLSVEGSNREDFPSAWHREKPEGVARACATIFRTSIGERTFSRCDAFVNGARPPRASHPFGVARRVFISITQVSIHCHTCVHAPFDPRQISSTGVVIPFLYAFFNFPWKINFWRECSRDFNRILSGFATRARLSKKWFLNEKEIFFICDTVARLFSCISYHVFHKFFYIRILW